MTQLYIKQRLIASIGGIGASSVGGIGASGVLLLTESLSTMLLCE